LRAFVIEGVDRYSIRDDVETAELGPGDVKVRMKAAGVCRTDHSAINGKWPTTLPCVDGHEGSGVIVEVGPAVTDREVGQHVVIGSPYCGVCYYCTHGAAPFCEQKDQGGNAAKFRLADGTPVYSMVGKGTWAEEMIVSAWGTTPIPPEVPFEIAALLGCAVMTGVGQVINVARPEVGASTIVFGGGGIGACAVMGAKLCGCAPIVAVDPAEPKHAALRHFGATHVITPDQVGETIAELTDGRGFDYVFENVGRPETLRAAWDATRKAGTVVVTGLGGTAGRVEFDLNELSVLGRRLLGNMAGGVLSPRDFPRYAELYLHGELDLDALISRRGMLDDLPAFLDALDDDPTVLRQVVAFG
jgi:S-(hydroxymethyl)glutathione dehydrogenase / alcohol dehydrogenase